MTRAALIIAALALAGCAGRDKREPVVQIQRVEVPVVKFIPCLTGTDIPLLPRSLHEEFPTMPGSIEEREALLAAKVAEWQGYAGQAAPLLVLCAKTAEAR